MSLKISKRKLADREIKMLAADINRFPHVGLIVGQDWHSLGIEYIAEVNNRFAGVCIAVPLGNWVKIGPVIILRQFQGKGYGRYFLTFVTNQYPDKRLYIGSSNPRIANIVSGLNFRREISFISLPWKIKLYLFRYLLKRLNKEFITDAWKKKLMKRPYPYNYFLRLPH